MLSVLPGSCKVNRRMGSNHEIELSSVLYVRCWGLPSSHRSAMRGRWRGSTPLRCHHVTWVPRCRCYHIASTRVEEGWLGGAERIVTLWGGECLVLATRIPYEKATFATNRAEMEPGGHDDDTCPNAIPSGHPPRPHVCLAPDLRLGLLLNS